MFGTILQIEIPGLEVPANPVNVSDSLKVVSQVIAQKIQEDPASFLHEVLDKLLHFGLKVLLAIGLYILGAWIISVIKRSLKRSFARHNTEGTLASFTLSLVSITLYTILIVSVVGLLGINTTSLAALMAAGGMAIGMALSGTVQNFAGGIMLLIFKPFKAGDFITAQGYSGTVTAVSIVSTKIRTVDNREIIIPNGALSNDTIDNYSSRPLRRIEWQISVEYGSNAQECIACMTSLMKKDPRILDSTTEPAADPVVLLGSLNDNDITFKARAWVKSEDYWDVFYEFNKVFYTELPKNGFSFAYPHMDVTLKASSDKEQSSLQ